MRRNKCASTHLRLLSRSMSCVIYFVILNHPTICSSHVRANMYRYTVSFQRHGLPCSGSGVLTSVSTAVPMFVPSSTRSAGCVREELHGLVEMSPRGFLSYDVPPVTTTATRQCTRQGRMNSVLCCFLPNDPYVTHACAPCCKAINSSKIIVGRVIKHILLQPMDGYERWPCQVRSFEKTWYM